VTKLQAIETEYFPCHLVQRLAFAVCSPNTSSDRSLLVVSRGQFSDITVVFQAADDKTTAVV